MKNPGSTAATYTAIQKPPLEPSATLKSLELFSSQALKKSHIKVKN